MERPRPTFVGVVAALAALVLVLSWSASEAPSASGGQLTFDDGVWIGGAVAGLIGGSLVVHVVVHELGHLLAALALRLPVLGVRIGPVRLGMERSSPGSAGHVLFDLGRVRRAMRARVVLMVLAGPAADLALVPVATALVSDRSAPIGVRAVAIGVAVALLRGGLENLSPLPPVTGPTTDGRSALRWLVRQSRERARIQSTVDLARLRAGSPQLAVGVGRRAHVRSLVDDPRPEVAEEAMKQFLLSRPVNDDGWDDVELMTGFAQRSEVPGRSRAALAGNYALSLGVAHVRTQQPGARREPGPEDVLRIARLAELALAADTQSIQARTALGLARILQRRAEDARSVLVSVPDGESAVLRARAFAVRAMAERELGDTASAVRLLASARQLAPDDRLVRLAAPAP